MARARNIKPGFFKNEDLGTADPFVSLLFAGLWVLADKAGILEDRPLRIKAELFPYREGFDINGYLTVLVQFKLIHRYEANGTRYIQIVNFKKHQNPHHTEKDSEFPSYSDSCAVTVVSPLITRDAPADSLIPDSLIPEIKEANASVNSAKNPAQVDPENKLPQCPVQQIVDLYHQKMPENPRVRLLDDARRKAIGARWKQAARMDLKPFGYTTGADGLTAWGRFFEVCAESDFLTGKTNPLPGKPPFVADIDFLMSPSGFKKCLENKYHRGAQ